MSSLRPLFCALALPALLVACGGSNEATGASASASSGAATSSSSGGGGSSTSSSTGATSSSSSSSGMPQHLDLLFIGNSFTFVNDLPSEVEALIVASGNADVMVDSVTVSGATLADLQSMAKARIMNGGFTHVILQGNSTEPLTDPATFETAALALAADAKAIGAEPVFYETWARKVGSPDYSDPALGGDPATMTAKVKAEYEKVAMQAGAPLARAGEAFQASIAAYPAIDLYESDLKHPSVAGTYLTASVFFGVIAKSSPVGVSEHPKELTDAEASELRMIAAQTP